MKLKMIIGATIIAAGAAGGAHAATTTFDFSKGSMAGVNSAFSSNTGKETLSVSGTRYRGSRVSSRHNSRLRQGANGFGLKNKKRRDSAKIDGKGGNDMAVVKFENNMKLNSITFGGVGKRSNAKFDLYVFNDGKWSRVAGNLNGDGKGRVQTFTFDQPVEGTTFGIGARNKRAAFNIRSLSASSINSVGSPADTGGTSSVRDVTPVPLPAGGLLLLTGLVGIGAARRKKRS